MPNASVATARSDARLIGFKLGYAMTESKYQGNLAMARLNLQEGFEVCGTRAEPHRLQVLYLKQLRELLAS